MRCRLGRSCSAIGWLAFAAAAGSACAATREAELEPRYVAVHNALAASGLAQVGPLQRGSLGQGHEARLRLELAAECTTIVAFGGQGASDVDLVLLDADDKAIARDTTKDAEPTLRACPSIRGNYTLVVKMTAGAATFAVATWAGRATSPSSLAPAADVAATTGSGTCESPFALTPGMTTGNTRRGEAEHAAGCASSDSKELVYKLEVTRRERVAIEVDPQFDSVLYLRKDECAEPDAEVACNDDTTAGGAKRGASSRGSRIDEILEPGTYFVFVDGYGSEAGAFQLDVRISDVPALADACRAAPLLTSAKIAGTLTGAFDNVHADCGEEAKGPDQLHRFDLGARARVRLTQRATDFTPVLHVRKECTDDRSEVVCTDSSLKTNEVVWSGLLEGGTYVVFADAAEKDARGSYTLEAEVAPEAGAGGPGDTCSTALPLLVTDRVVDGDTFLARDDIAAGCSVSGAADVVYRFELSRRSRVLARFGEQEAPHVLSLRKECAERKTEIACGGAIDEVLNPGVYYLAVDGSAADALGRFRFGFVARDVSAQEAACRQAKPLVSGSTTTGSTASMGDKFNTSCAGREETQSSNDRVYSIKLDARAHVRLTLTTPTWDGVLALRKSCLDPPRAAGARAAEVACNNDSQDAQHAKIDTVLDPGTYWVVVDGHQERNEGPFTLEYRVLK